jgi:hypothetical protein
MFSSLVEVPGGRDRSKILVFVRGFQGWNNFRLRLPCCGSHAMTTQDELEWYAACEAGVMKVGFSRFKGTLPLSIASQKRAGSPELSAPLKLYAIEFRAWHN